MSKLSQLSSQFFGNHQVGESRHGFQTPHIRLEPSVGLARFKQEVGNAVVDSHMTPEKRWVRMRRFLEQLHQFVLEEGRGRSEALPARNFSVNRGAKQIEDQIHARPSFGDVVLKIGIQALIARIDIGSKRNQEAIRVERSKPEERYQLSQGRFRRVIPNLRNGNGREPGGTGRLSEELVHFGLGNTQTAKLLVLAVLLPHCLDVRLDNLVNPA
jgi:hypothetical protein